MREQWEPPKMGRYSEKVLAQAREEAQLMIEGGEDKRALDVGEQPEALWISVNPDLVVGSETFSCEGRTVYIGLLKERTGE